MVLTDALLIGAAAYALDPASSGLSRRRSQLAFALVVGHAGLLLVDHIHFQYNGMLLGGLPLCLSWSKRNEARFVSLLSRPLLIRWMWMILPV